MGEAFTEAALAGQPAVITRPDLPDHGLRVQFLRGQDKLVTRVVTFAQPDSTRDVEVERTTCRHLAELESAWSERGVGATLYHQRDAGEIDVVQVRREQITATKRRRRDSQERAR